jgi:hypothetical protein
MSDATATVNALAILPAWEDQISLQQIFWRSKWDMHPVDGLSRSWPLMDNGVVISDDHLPDGHCARPNPSASVRSTR